MMTGAIPTIDFALPAGAQYAFPWCDWSDDIAGIDRINTV